MKRRKRIVMSVICGLLVAAVALGGTLAYLTDSESITNTFTVGTGYVGNDAFTLDETEKPATGLPTEPDLDPSDRTEIGQEYPGLLPGTQFAKDPTFHLGTNGNGTHVIESYIIAKLDKFDAAKAKGYKFFKADGKTEGLNNRWVKVAELNPEAELDKNKLDGYYLYTENGTITEGDMDVTYTPSSTTKPNSISILGPGADTDPLFTYVQLKDMGNDEFKNMENSLDVNISGVAVQAPYTSPSEAVAAAIDKLK